MDSRVRRAAAFAAVSTLSLAMPVAGALVAVPFALIAVIGRTLSDGVVFDLFATPEDRAEGELRGLVGFALAATALALLGSLSSLPNAVFIVSMLVVGVGSLGERLACVGGDTEIRRAVGFAVGGGGSAIAGLWLVAAATAGTTATVDATAVFLSAVGALLASLFRTAFVRHEDPVVMVSVAILLWVLSSLSVPIGARGVGLAVVIAGGFGLLSWAVGTASVTGMLTGVTLATTILVFGGVGWFAILLAFAGIGGAASKYRYEDKRFVGVAEENEGARGGRNVLGNGAVALLAILGYAAAEPASAVRAAFLFAFVGSLATATSDTLSSEIGVLYGPPRLITTLEPVEAGTDGGVTAQGSLAGVGGSALIAVVSVLLLPVGPAGAAVVAAAGVAGMLADSLLGATVEGGVVGNQGVNFLATLVGAVLSVAGGILVGIVP